eukprot:gene3548-biopygen2915
MPAGGALITVFCRDISEQIASERRFAELGAELAHVSRQSAMSELAADLAHELNQPLSATVNFLATARILIAQGGEVARIGDLLRMGEEQTLRSGEIIRRLRRLFDKRESGIALAVMILFGVLSHLTMMETVAVLVAWTGWLIWRRTGRLSTTNAEVGRIFAPSFLTVLPLAACMIVDGDGRAHGMICRRTFRSEKQARKAFAQLI